MFIGILLIILNTTLQLLISPSVTTINEHYILSKENFPLPEDNQFIYNSLQNFNVSQLKEKPDHFSIFLKDHQNKINGGILVSVYSDAIYVNGLWVDQLLRNKGYGQKLLGMAEEEAKKRGKKYCKVDTYDFQAKDFYVKQGYNIIGEIKDYLLGHSRIYLRKKI